MSTTKMSGVPIPSASLDRSVQAELAVVQVHALGVHTMLYLCLILVHMSVDMSTDSITICLISVHML